MAEMETDTTYVPPQELSDIDDQVIHRRMLAALPQDIDTTEGGFAWDFTAPAAIEKAGLMVDLNEAIQLFFPEWSYGSWLDALAANVGLSRRVANAAYGAVRVTGAAGTVIPDGFLFATASTGEEASVEYAAMGEWVIPQEGQADVHVECVLAGEEGNMPAHAVTLMVSPLPGVTGVDNPAPMTGGAGEEEDDSLRQRIALIEKASDTSFVGNVADYKRWALEVSGVGAVIVVPEWAGKGTGTVKLILSDSNGQPANEEICQDVYDYIMCPDAPETRKAPIGAILTVEASTIVSLSVTASVTLNPGYDVASAKALFQSAMEGYLAQAAQDGVVRYTRVGGILSGLSAILDYDAASLLVNNGTANILLEQGQTPVLSGAEFSLSEVDQDA